MMPFPRSMLGYFGMAAQSDHTTAAHNTRKADLRAPELCHDLVGKPILKGWMDRS